MQKLIILFSIITHLANSETIATGDIKGHYHTLGTAFCEKKENCKVLPTSGTLENIKFLKKERADYAYIQSNLFTDGLEVAQHTGVEEKFHILYKGEEVNSWKELINTKDYTLNYESGNYAIFQKITEILNATQTKEIRHEKNKPQSFCDRKTTATFANIHTNGLVGLQLKLDALDCAKVYKFNKKEQEALKRNNIEIRDGEIWNEILLVKNKS